MRVRVYSKGKFDTIKCPEGTRIVRCAVESGSDIADAYHLFIAPFRDLELEIPSDPPELLPLLAESGRCGLSLFGKPVPDLNLARAVCPSCDERDGYQLTRTQIPFTAIIAAATSD
jgi:hypothetical protein